MKTRKEWIDTLPEDIRERAYKYTDKDKQGNLESRLSEAILGAFVWDETPEKHKFWSLVARGEFDKARELLPKQEPAEQIFDRVASSTMVNYDPNGFRTNYKTLFKTIILAIDEARELLTNNTTKP